VQALSPKILKQHTPTGFTAQILAFGLTLIPAGIALALAQELNPTTTLISGLFVFGVVFAINSAVHSYLILAYADHDKVAMNVGFYYMANAGGRLTGTVLSGLVYQQVGLVGCLWFSTAFLMIAGVLSLPLKQK